MQTSRRTRHQYGVIIFLLYVETVFSLSPYSTSSPMMDDSVFSPSSPMMDDSDCFEDSFTETEPNENRPTYAKIKITQYIENPGWSEVQNVTILYLIQGRKTIYQSRSVLPRSDTSKYTLHEMKRIQITCLKSKH